MNSTIKAANDKGPQLWQMVLENIEQCKKNGSAPPLATSLKGSEDWHFVTAFTGGKVLETAH
jgi:hypothetical protein